MGIVDLANAPDPSSYHVIKTVRNLNLVKIVDEFTQCHLQDGCCECQSALDSPMSLDLALARYFM